MNRVSPEQEAGVMDAVRDTASGLGELVGLHLKVARRELTGELRALGGQAASLGIFAALLLVGYALAMAGVAMVMGGLVAVGKSFLIIGGGHVAVAVVAGFVWVQRSKAGRRPLAVTADEVQKSLRALIRAH
jgi:hypothetical protein